MDNGSTNKCSATFRSGNVANYNSIAIGRASDEARLGVAAVVGDFSTSAQAGDFVIRAENSSRAVRILAGSGISMLAIGNRDVYLTPLTPNANFVNLQVNTTTGLLTYPSSSRRFKENIVDYKINTSAIYKAKVREFNYKKENGDYHDIGLVAEELDEIPELKHLVAYNKDKEPESVHYQKIGVYLLAEMQKLVKRVEELEELLSNKRKAE